MYVDDGVINFVYEYLSHPKPDAGDGTGFLGRVDGNYPSRDKNSKNKYIEKASKKILRSQRGLGIGAKGGTSNAGKFDH